MLQAAEESRRERVGSGGNTTGAYCGFPDESRLSCIVQMCAVAPNTTEQRYV